jgi:hypothetical protein
MPFDAAFRRRLLTPPSDAATALRDGTPYGPRYPIRRGLGLRGFSERHTHGFSMSRRAD